MDKEQQKILQDLVNAIDKAYTSKRRLILRSFVAGIFYGLGATIGISIILFLIGVLIHYIGGIPVFGHDIAQFLTKIVTKP